jgi:hypothetical protein
MRVFHFLNEEYGLKDLRERRLKIALIMELNDPFEFLGPELSDRAKRRDLLDAKKTLAKEHGLLCFSGGWRNPVHWSHYGDKHRGLCLGFDVPDEMLKQVVYVTARSKWPETLTEDFAKAFLFTKFAHWSYEDEYRVFTTLEEQENGVYFAEFSDQLKLRQVIVGAESTTTRADITEALGDLADGVEAFKARVGFRSFRVVRNQKYRLWV